MRISYNWLKELLPDLQATPQEVAALLTTHSFETVIASEWKIDPKITTVRIEQIEKHPKADRLQLATVTDGKAVIKVVCGAPNIKVGQIAPYCPPGSVVFDEEGKEFEVKEAVIRGETSPGMLNSVRELGLGKSHAGIWELPEDTPLGNSLVELIGNDTILEADITPNRGHDCLSHIGIAREVAALLKLTVNEPEAMTLPDAQKEVAGWNVTITDSAATPRYIGALFENTSVHSSPLWMQARLLAVGTRPINNIVDISNYVMFEQGNPTHTFDADKLPDKNIGVRLAKKAEKLRTLDGVDHELAEDSLVITSEDEPVAVAGVMGGESSEVSATTKSIFLEVASFNAYAIQKSATRLGMISEGSSRWVKGVDPNVAPVATARMATLLQQLAGAHLVGVVDVYPKPTVPHTIAFRSGRVSDVAGVAVPSSESRAILERLGFTATEEKEHWQVTVPTVRQDITGEHDLVEEVIRVYGLEKIESLAPHVPLVAQPLATELKWPEVWRDLLVGAGFTELYNYSFEDSSVADLLGFNKIEHLKLVNPVAPELATMRVSMLPGLLKNVVSNQTNFPAQKLFELGRVFYPGAGKVPGVQEQIRLAGTLTGETEGFRVLKGVVEELLHRCGLQEVDFNQHNVSPDDSLVSLWERGRVAEIIVGSTELGTVGQLSEKLQKKLKLKQPVFLFDINGEALIKEASFERQFKPLPKYPPVYRDISFVVSSEISVERAKGVIETNGGELLADVELFDIYEPSMEEEDSTAPGKSLAFHLRYEDPEKTLTDEDVNQIHGKIILALERELNAQIRA